MTTLRELTIVWHLYGGRDFSTPSSSEAPNQKHGRPSGSYQTADGATPDKKGAKMRRDMDRRSGGGTARQVGQGRDHDVLVEIELNKVLCKFVVAQWFYRGTLHSASHTSRDILTWCFSWIKICLSPTRHWSERPTDSISYQQIPLPILYWHNASSDPYQHGSVRE